MSRREERLRREIESHLRMAIQDRIERGESPEEAEADVRREFGNKRLIEEVTRDMCAWNWLEQSWRDVRYALRGLQRNPAFTIASLTALALGIGAITAVFSIVNSVLLRPLPYAEPERLVWIHDGMTAHDAQGWSACVADFLLWRDRARSFSSLAAFGPNGFNLTGVGEAELIRGAAVTAAFFEVLGVRPIMGRTFAAGEDQPGREPTALISESLWRRRFGGSPDVVGKKVALNDRQTTIIGVLPASFQFRLREADIWGIFTLDPPTRRGPFFLRGVARLRPGVSLAQASAELDALGKEVEDADPKHLVHSRYPMTSLTESLVGDVRQLLLVLTGAVVLVQLIVVFNVGNLLLARASTREREIAIRLSLGAAPGHLIRQLMTESLTLASIGGGAGFLLAWQGVRALKLLAPPGIPRLDEIGLDARVLAFTAAVSLVSGLLFGLAPVFTIRTTRAALTAKASGRGTIGSYTQGMVRNLLVATEVALSLILMTGAGLLIRSFALLGHVAPGFQSPPTQVLTMRISPVGPKYRNNQVLSSYWDQIVERVRHIPGVEGAGLAVTVPPDRVAFGDAFEIPQRTPPEGGPVVPVVVASPGYFQALRIPLLQGRIFDERDTTASPGVTVISETLERRYFPGENPIGQRLKHGGPQLNNPYMEIIGVVGDVKYDGLDYRNEPVYYEALAQSMTRPLWHSVRFGGDLSTLVKAVRGEIHSLDSNVPVSQVGLMSQAISDSLNTPRFRSAIMGVFAAAALLLTVVGIYGVISFSVSQRTQEIGIRMALGASGSSVLQQVIMRALAVALGGVSVGVVGALTLARVLKQMLFGIAPTDPLTFVGVVVLILIAATVASYIPAHRASRVDPMTALRYE